MSQSGALKAKGAQVVACLSVNDVFVTEEWGQAHNAEGKVRLLADPTGAFGKVSVPSTPTLPGGPHATPWNQGLGGTWTMWGAAGRLGLFWGFPNLFSASPLRRQICC